MSAAFDEDDHLVNPLDEHTDLLEKITGLLGDIKRAGPPLTEADVGAIRSALDTVAYHAPAAARHLSSIKLAAWIIAVASVLHLFR